MTTRRTFLAANLIGAAGLAANPSRIYAAPADPASGSAVATPPLSDRNFWSDWPNLLIAEMNEARKKRLAKLASLRSVAQLQERAAFVRSHLWELLGGQLEKTPLNAKITGTLNRGSYKIEKLIFESMPGIYVTANLYLPASGKPPYPAILAPVGHSDNGKEYHYYQHLYQNLARMGYVVLSYDPFGQGERLQYFNPQTGKSLYGPTGEHSEAGRPMILFGENLALYSAWDGIRGVDYLLTRPEVDPKRLGCTGQSGGGTMTMYLAALESRLSAAVVSDGNTENIAGPYFNPPGATDDAEQNIVGSLPFGIDRGDLLLAFAPKPLLICYTTHDEGTTYSPVYEESTQHIHEEMQRAYRIFGREDQAGLYASHLPHSLNYFNRMQTYAWFEKWLYHRSTEIKEAPLDVIPEKLLNATTTGLVLTSLGGRSVVELNTDRARAVIQKSAFRARPLNDPALQSKARQKLTDLLALPKRKTPLQAKTRSVNRRPGAVIDEIQFDSEPGMRIPGWFAAPSSGSGPRPVVLYLTEYAGDEVVEEPGSMDRVLAAGCSVCAIGLRGANNLTMPRFPDNGPLYYSEGSVFVWERFAWTCLVLGRSVLGQRVWDALQAIDYLAARPDVDKSQIRILGVEGAGTVALMTAFLDPRVRAVLLNRTIVSYMSIVESESYSLRLDWFAPGILRNFDLPEIAAGMGTRPCWLMNGVDANGIGMPLSAIQEQYGRKFTGETKLPETLRFVVNTGDDPQRTYLEWLKRS